VLACFEGVKPREPQTVSAPVKAEAPVLPAMLREIDSLAVVSPAAKRVLDRAQDHYQVIDWSEFTAEQAAQVLKRMKEEAAK